MTATGCEASHEAYMVSYQSCCSRRVYPCDFSRRVGRLGVAAGWACWLTLAGGTGRRSLRSSQPSVDVTPQIVA